jgi:hypothetical protein
MFFGPVRRLVVREASAAAPPVLPAEFAKVNMLSLDASVPQPFKQHAHTLVGSSELIAWFFGAG